METIEIKCRCKDCKYSEIRLIGDPDLMFCAFWSRTECLPLLTVNKNDFCSNAELPKGD